MSDVLFDMFLFRYQSGHIALEKPLVAFDVQVRFSVTTTPKFFAGLTIWSHIFICPFFLIKTMLHLSS